ncbi:hypothetical protein O9992_07725 [Vibrio lentus]|nr:hypothetical protein [Vibrio lentus]
MSKLNKRIYLHYGNGVNLHLELTPPGDIDNPDLAFVCRELPSSSGS